MKCCFKTIKLTVSPDLSAFCETSSEGCQIGSRFGLVFLNFSPYLVWISHFFGPKIKVGALDLI